jgi:putative transposase
VKTLATLSDGSTIAGPKAHTNLLGKLRRSSRALFRKRKGSQNRRKAQKKLARLHARIANIRKDATHKATTMLAKNCQRIGIEELNVRSMSRNRRLARSVMDGGFYELRRQLEYKAKMYGSLIVVADRWYPSSKTCSCCGVVKQTLALSQRTFNCDDCGFEVDRDVNAARNLESVAASSAVTVCGEDRSGGKRKPRVKRTSVKHRNVQISRICADISERIIDRA